MVIKVKEPIASEYHRMREDQTLFTYLHLAADEPLTGAAEAASHGDGLRDRPVAAPASFRCSSR